MIKNNEVDIITYPF